MQTTLRSLITSIHGILFGGLFLIALGATWVEALRQTVMARAPELTPRGRWLEKAAYLVMAAFGWIAVLSGTYVIYPWYRARPPAAADLHGYPRSLLLAGPATTAWHTTGMEWKEYVGWFAPIIATMLAFVLIRHAAALRADKRLGRAVFGFACAGMLGASIAGFFGAMLDKTAPVAGGRTYTVIGAAHE